MNLENVMKPPWAIFAYPQTSMGWRMGGGEDYLLKWHKWFTHLSQEEQQAYVAQYSEPEDWFHFYELRLTQSDEEYATITEHIQRLRTAYCDLHYELAGLHEEARHYEHAVEHMGKVIFCITNYQIWDDVKTDEAIEHYAALKRHLVRHMALNPAIRKGWNALRQSKHRMRITLERTTVTAEDYARMQQKVFLPLDFGLTWTKCFEDETLYIHRHWQEPCLFLVILEQTDQGYHIAETWMNDTIPHPLTNPPAPGKPDQLLTFLLGWFIKK